MSNDLLKKIREGVKTEMKSYTPPKEETPKKVKRTTLQVDPNIIRMAKKVINEIDPDKSHGVYLNEVLYNHLKYKLEELGIKYVEK